MEPSENLQNLTQMLSYDGMNNQPFILQTSIFSFVKFSSVGSYFLGCPRNFVDRRIRIFERWAWMWCAHDHTRFIHDASMTWTPKNVKPIMLRNPTHAPITPKFPSCSSREIVKELCSQTDVGPPLFSHYYIWRCRWMVSKLAGVISPSGLQLSGAP